MGKDTRKRSPAGRWVHVEVGDYRAFMPYPLPPKLTWTPELIRALSEADRAVGALAGLGRMLPNPHILIAPFIRREAVLSSQIEGTQATLTDLYAYEAVQRAPESAPGDVREVSNYVKALEYGLERLETLPISLRLIRELHQRLMDDVRGNDQTPGAFRRSQNWIGAPGSTLDRATFVPPPVNLMHEALETFEDYLHREPVYPPLIRLGLIHYQFETIHPFLDGNGRVGRLLLTLLLCAWQLLPQPLLYLSAYFEAARRTYYDLLLGVSREGEWDGWLRFFLDGVTRQAQDAVTRAGRLQALREEFRAQVQASRAAARLLQVVDLLFANPIVDMPGLMEALEISHQSASRYVETLEALGILQEVTGQARNRVYRADAVLQAIEAPV